MSFLADRRARKLANRQDEMASHAACMLAMFFD